MAEAWFPALTRIMHIVWVDLMNHGDRHQPGTPVMKERAPVGSAPMAPGVSLEVAVLENRQILPLAVLGVTAAREPVPGASAGSAGSAALNKARQLKGLMGGQSVRGYVMFN